VVSDLEISCPLDARSAAAHRASRRLTSRDADTMDLVFLLFEQLLAAPDIPDAIKVLVSRLQIPYLKLAVIEPQFFDDPDHPARRLLNRIARVSIGWTDDGERGPDTLHGRVRHIVERVVTEFHSDPRLFVALDADLADYQRQCEREVRRAETRTVRIAGSREAHQRVRRRVMEAIDERLLGRDDIPSVVATIVYDGWSQVMLKALEQHGEDSHGWRQTLRVLDRLLWSVEPKPDPAARRDLLRRIPELLRRLREQLAGVISDQRLIARWLKELQTLHIAVLRGPAGAPSGAAPPFGEPVAASAEPAFAKRFDVDALALGTWLAVARDDGAWLRVKLAWRSDDGDALLLVDQHGQKGIELSRGNLTALLEQELAEVIGDGREPIVDRAVAAVRQTLSHA
jgi:hypothetical protein